MEGGILMGGKGSGRWQPKQPIPERPPMFIPNLSGDHSAGNVQNTPVKDTDMVNKKYVDSAISSEDFWNRTGTTVYPKNSGDTISGSNIILANNITHEGDTNTVIQLSSDQFNWVTGASTRFTVNNSGVQISNGVLDMNGNDITEGGTITCDHTFSTGSFTGTGAYTNFTISGGLIIAAS